MNKSNFLSFEEEGQDFPFYNKQGQYTKKDAYILLIAIILFTLLITGPIKFYNGQEQIIIFLTMTFMMLLFNRTNHGTFFKKPRKKDLRTIIVCYILFHVYYLVAVNFLQIIHYPTVQYPFTQITLMMLIIDTLQIIAEEIFRAMLLLLVLYITYQKTQKRKKSVIISMIITMTIFGLLHYNTYPSILQILLLQGFGSIFELYPYLKTKNLTLSVTVHFLINLASWAGSIII